MVLQETEDALGDRAPGVASDLPEHRVPVGQIAAVEDVVDRRGRKIGWPDGARNLEVAMPH